MQDNFKKRLKVVLTGIGVIFFWRGCWHLLDEIFMPYDPLLTSILCVVIGLTTVLWVNYDNF